MNELIQLLQSIIERGLLFGSLVGAVYLASRVIRLDNLSIEGAFGIGGAVTALLVTKSYDPWIALLGATLVGGISGSIMGLLATKLRINPIISGIVVTTGLFSIILKVAGSNLPLIGKATIFTSSTSLFENYGPLIILAIVCGFVFTTISWFLKTEIGFLLFAVGENPQMLVNVGKNVDGYVILGLALSNMLAALSGALFVHHAGYFSIWTSVGMLIIGLAGMILAETIAASFGTALLIGSILYQIIITLTFELQVDQEWNKLITALLIVVLIALKQALPRKQLS